MFNNPGSTQEIPTNSDTPNPEAISPQTSLKPLKELSSTARKNGMLPSRSAVDPLNNFPDDFAVTSTSGVGIFAQLNFSSTTSGSLTDNLNLVSNSTLSSTIIRITGYLGKSSETRRMVGFSGSISSIQLMSSLFLKDILITYRSVVTEKAQKTTLELGGTCVLRFSETQTWSLGGNAIITSSDATFELSLAQATLAETLGISIKEVKLRLQYTFQTGAVSDAQQENSGVIKHGDRSGTYNIDLSAKVTLGSVEATLTLAFVSSTPSVLKIQVPGELNIGVLLQNLFGPNFPAALLDISFSELTLYYSWLSTTPPSNPGSTPNQPVREPRYLPGFHVQAKTSIYGRFYFQFLIT